jgi:DNA-binding SARP family transcriptional activator/tetratricopeptide (TPR) repeat protein
MPDDEPKFTLLGPVRAWRGETELALGSAQQRAVLVALLLRGNTHVSVGGLVQSLWGDNAPRSAESVIRTYIYRLRRILQPDGSSVPPVIVSVGSGYLVETTPQSSDLAAFRQAMAEAEKLRRTGDAAAAAARVRDGLALWHGDALTDIPGPYAEAQRESLHQKRRTATELLLAAEVDLGASGDTVAEITALLDQDPLNERLRELLMLALYRRGEQAHALEVYRQGVDVLSEELGIDPGPGLRTLFDRILQADPALLVRPPTAQASPPRTASPPPVVPPARLPVPPAQLPAALPTFVGRDDELAQLESLLPAPDDPHPAAAVAVVTGMAGVGKTTLAVHWAHRVAHHYPDGALYLRLHWCAMHGATTSPGEAISTILHAFGIPTDQIPPGLDAKTAMYRSVLAGRRVLLLLDDAHDAEQVRPLLPGTPGCMVIVTSRRRLTGLVALDGARSVRLDPLDSETANDMLVSRLGAQRVTADPQAAAELIQQCAGLPLALAVIATRANTHRTFALGDLAAELQTLRTGLDAFDDHEASLNLRAAFACSYTALSPAAARLFRLLAEHADPDFTAHSAAAVLAAPVERVRAALDELTHTELLIERTPGRYTYHNLLRAYAVELAAQVEPDAIRAAARSRLFDYFRYSAWSATATLYPNEDLAEPPVDAPAGTEQFADKTAALAWMTRQHPAIRTAIINAERAGADRHICDLARVLSTFLQRQDLWDDQLTVQNKAIEAARRLGDDAARARAHRTIANTYSRLGRHGDASKYLATAHDLLAELGDVDQLAQLHRSLAAA